MVLNIRQIKNLKWFCLIVLYGAAKLAIWCTRKNKVEGRESIDTVLMMRDFIKKRLMKKYAYYNLSNDVESFFMCGVRMVLYVKLMIREVLCLIYECKKVFFVLFLIIYLCISYMKKIKNLYVWMIFFYS